MPPPVRAPFPWDVVIGGQGFLTGSPTKGGPAPMTATKPPDLAQQSPNELGYDAQNPIISSTQSYDNLSGGFGQEIQIKSHDNRYHYALNVDWSGGTFGVLGPRLFEQTWPSQGETPTDVSDFFELDGILYALNGHWAQGRSDDTPTGWYGAIDFGAGVATHAKSFFASFAGGDNLAYIGMGDTDFMWKWDGLNATKHASLKAQDFALTSQEFWRAVLPNDMEKVAIDADPWDANNWTIDGTYLVGNKQYPIQRLATAISDTVLALKTDGIYTLNNDGDTVDLYPYLHFAPDDLNGAYGDWLNDIYLTYGSGAYQIKPTPVLGSTNLHLPINQIGPERVIDNTSEVKGRITAYAGHDSFCLYAGLYNTDTGDSYLLKFGQWIEGDGVPQRAEVWHGSITAAFKNKRITAMHVTTVGAIANHKRLYLGFSDSTVQWFTLPCTPNPCNCDAYLFSLAEGTLRLPWAHLMFRNDIKVLRDVTVAGMNLSDSDYCQVQVSSAPNVDFQFLVDLDTNPVNFDTTPLQTIPLGPGSINKQAGALDTLAAYTLDELSAFTLDEMSALVGAPGSYSGRYIGLDLMLRATSAGTSPRVIGVGFSYQARLPLNKVRGLDLLTDQYLTKRDGTPTRLTSADWLTRIEALATQTVPSPTTLPNQRVTNLSVVGYRETTLWSERFHNWFGGVHLDCVEQAPLVAPGLPAFGTLNRLAQYTLDELAAFSLNELETL